MNVNSNLNKAERIAYIDEKLQSLYPTTPVPLDHKDPYTCLLYTSPSPRDRQKSRMPSSA